MKKVTTLLICISLLVVGCAPSGGPKQMIHTKSWKEIPVRLLSVRPDAFLVERLPTRYDDLPDTILIERIPIDSISQFSSQDVGTAETIMFSGVVGLLVGGAITGFSGYAQYYAPIGLVLGICTGSIISANKDHVYYPQDPNDLEKIAGYAIYKGEEPDKLKKIQ